MSYDYLKDIKNKHLAKNNNKVFIAYGASFTHNEAEKIIGKTIEKVECGNEYFWITFNDGSVLEIDVRNDCEGGYLEAYLN